jgi:hypothetical protein
VRVEITRPDTLRPSAPCGLEVDHELELGRLLDCELDDDLRAVTF